MSVSNFLMRVFGTQLKLAAARGGQRWGDVSSPALRAAGKEHGAEETQQECPQRKIKHGEGEKSPQGFAFLSEKVPFEKSSSTKALG